MNLLNAELIRRRRLELGLSLREVAKYLGGTAQVVLGIENGSNHERITVAVLANLAELLGVDPADLLAVTEPPKSDRSELAGRVGSLLQAVAGPVSVDTLADVLSTPIADIWSAVDVLDDLLRPAGLRVQRVGPDVAVCAGAAIDARPLRETMRRDAARRGLQTNEVDLLSRIVDGKVDEKSLGNSDRVALGRLRNAGIVSDSGLAVLEAEIGQAGVSRTASRSAPAPQVADVDLVTRPG